MATTHVSASEITSSLKGISLPATVADLRRQAQENGVEEHVLAIIDQMPDREYNSAADIAKGVSEATTAIKETLPHSSASEVLSAIKGVSFPASKKDLVSQAESNGASEDVIGTLQSLKPKKFESVNEISAAMSEARSG